MGKSTISTGPFSIAFCRFTRGLLGRIPQVAWVAWNRPGSTCSGGISASLPWTPEISWIEQGASKKPGWWCNNHFEKYEFVNGVGIIPYMKWKIIQSCLKPPIRNTSATHQSIEYVVCVADAASDRLTSVWRVLACVTVTYKKVSGH